MMLNIIAVMVWKALTLYRYCGGAGSNTNLFSTFARMAAVCFVITSLQRLCRLENWGKFSCCQSRDYCHLLSGSSLIFPSASKESRQHVKLVLFLALRTDSGVWLSSLRCMNYRELSFALTGIFLLLLAINTYMAVLPRSKSAPQAFIVEL